MKTKTRIESLYSINEKRNEVQSPSEVKVFFSSCYKFYIPVVIVVILGSVCRWYSVSFTSDKDLSIQSRVRLLGLTSVVHGPMNEREGP